jgi:hypothetical protein
MLLTSTLVYSENVIVWDIGKLKAAIPIPHKNLPISSFSFGDIIIPNPMIVVIKEPINILPSESHEICCHVKKLRSP